MQLIGRRRFLIAAAGGLPVPMMAWAATGAPVRPLTVDGRWSTGNATLTPATLSGGRAYFAGDQAVGAVDLGAESLAWRQSLAAGRGCVFRPRIADSVLICGSGAGLAAWASDDGRPLWQLSPGKQFGTPLLDDGRLYCGDGDRIVAIDAASGAPLWSFNTVADTIASYAPAVAGDTLLVGPGDGRLYGLDKRDGRLRWQVDGMKRWQYLRQLHVDGGILVAGAYQETLHGFDVMDGRELWSFYAGNFINSHHVADGAAYLWSPTGWVFALDIRSGGLRWRHRTTDYRGSAGNWGPLMAELVTAADHLFALDMGDTLHLLSRHDGAETARFKAPTGCRPFVLPLPDGKVLLGSRDGSLLRGVVG
ncbi:PQQ-like beta-propeller repeat protein [Magnetospirillum sp. UT-4]|uniref:outer membrane protein assembly factor BamB family protein n=1 Tax=Magnetospirillum sp. UT-4 TaxID=2681467 RepID=UPI001384F8C3|nr:PQQ-like beta-propeller repeat protein [Magnetospirillum sp. UT-4]CAA7621212.1 FoxY [Magnetospirillum sp. UT-4]